MKLSTPRTPLQQREAEAADERTRLETLRAQCRNIINLGDHPGWHAIVLDLVAKQEKMRDTLEQATDAHAVGRAQGALAQLRYLLEIVPKAKEQHSAVVARLEGRE